MFALLVPPIGLLFTLPHQNANIICIPYASTLYLEVTELWTPSLHYKQR